MGTLRDSPIWHRSIRSAQDPYPTGTPLLLLLLLLPPPPPQGKWLFSNCRL